jgi:hypothetical protein
VCSDLAELEGIDIDEGARVRAADGRAGTGDDDGVGHGVSPRASTQLSR